MQQTPGEGESILFFALHHFQSVFEQYSRSNIERTNQLASDKNRLNNRKENSLRINSLNIFQDGH